jgi:sulfatase maturation enzyme AslB (radical SAM superfamily)
MSLTFLITFILIKVVNTHSVSHITEENTTEKCQFCEFYSASEQGAFLTSVIQVSENTKDYQEIEYQIFYKIPVFSEKTHPGNFFNRPPPFLV